MKRNDKGFTLIEVIVVIVMIGILAAIAVPIYSGYIYRARASEGIVILGAVKTFALERRNSTGLWPTKTDIMNEFHSFKELYYFQQDIEVKEGTDKIALKLIADTKFGLPSENDGVLQVDISLVPTGTNTGWSGGVTEYARHLPVCTDKLSF